MYSLVVTHPGSPLEAAAHLLLYSVELVVEVTFQVLHENTSWYIDQLTILQYSYASNGLATEQLLMSEVFPASDDRFHSLEVPRSNLS